MANRQVKDARTTTLMRYEADEWKEVTTVPYAVNGCELELAIPAQWLGLKGKEGNFDFKWADNPGPLKDIISLCVHGDTAPNRRFNYRFIWKK